MSEYSRKRNFAITAEPPDAPVRHAGKKVAASLRFVVQKHAASHLHYDFRLELDGTLKSWAIPKGPSLDPSLKRLAVHVEDHPLAYASFEGTIAPGQYGAGDVIVWDQGIWQPHEAPGKAYRAGKLKFTLIGEKLGGDWTLVRTHLKGSGDKEQWLLIKERDQAARPAEKFDIVAELPNSVISGADVSMKKPAARTRSTESKTRTPAGHFPDRLAPELATLVDKAPAGDWRYEIKFDGYRLLTRIQAGEVRLFTRNGHDWTDKLPRQVKAIEALKLDDSWLDGEIVVLDEAGLPDFQALQNAFDLGRSLDMIYYLFDLPFCQGEDLRQQPLEDRRARLKTILASHKHKLLRYSDAFSARQQDILQSACAMKLEGVIGKRAGSPYRSTRSTDWIKLKCQLRQEFVVVGYTAPQGSRSGFGALLLAVHERKQLRYAGRVGTGFDQATLDQIHGCLKHMHVEASPLGKPLSSSQARGVQWVEPQLAAEVEFAQWTREGIVRHASFVALRSDKPAAGIVHERPLQAERPAPGKKSVIRPLVDGVPISHPERVIDAVSGTQKLQLAQFYGQIAEWVLPHLKRRPVALLRAPEGIEGEQFFQKHAERLAIPHIKQLDPKLDPGHARLLEIDSEQALIGAVQMGTIEFHTWGSTSDRIDTPDHFVLDLDPDPALPWRSMLEATQLTLAALDELGLDCYLKTSGGKGMHLIVPLARHAGWDTVKAFAKGVAQFMTQQLPERFTATMGPKNRIGKIFVDYLRNQRGASTVVAYSVRARPGLPVSVPIERSELGDLGNAQHWNVGNVLERLHSLKADPWQGYSNRQRITRQMWEKLGCEPV